MLKHKNINKITNQDPFSKLAVREGGEKISFHSVTIVKVTLFKTCLKFVISTI